MADHIIMPLKKLAGETTHERPFQWWYEEGSLIHDHTPHGDIILGSRCNLLPQWKECDGSMIELGGGTNHPVIRPNVNIVPGPGVDILHDLNNPFPMESNTYYFVYSCFVIEHIKNSRIKQFISECFRITKPGGLNVHVGPNLKAQCASIASLEKWTYHDINMIFGGDENPKSEDPFEGYHHTGMSPELAVDMFKEAGFYEVVVWEYPRFHLEMIIEAWKD